MNITTNPHPLILWLKPHGHKLYVFARKKGINARSLYAHVKGEVSNPRLDIMQAVETSTDGAVTVQSQAEWFSDLKAKGFFDGRQHKRPQRKSKSSGNP